MKGPPHNVQKACSLGHNKRNYYTDVATQSLERWLIQKYLKSGSGHREQQLNQPLRLGKLAIELLDFPHKKSEPCVFGKRLHAREQKQQRLH